MGVRLGAWALVAVLGALLVRCGSARCPEGTAARFDQCVRFSEDRDASTEPPRDRPCTAERMWSGDRCVLKDVYVDPANGDDSEHADAGSLQRPLRTFQRAVSAAVEHQTIHFEPRVYATEAGHQFNAVVPNGVTLRTRAGRAGRAVFVANRLQSLVFAGNALLIGIELRRFDSPVRASSGNLQLTEVSVTEVVGDLEIAGSARLTCSDCRFEAGPARDTPLIVVRGMAALTLLHSTLLTAPDATCEGDTADAIRVTDSASLVLSDTHVSGSFAQAVLSTTEGSVRITSSTFARGCTNNSLVWERPWSSRSLATVDIEGSVFDADAGGTGGLARVRVRGTTFRTLFWVLFTVGGIYDFGKPSRYGAPEAGGNTFKELSISGTDVVFFASGNTWNPDQQGADARGHYADGETRNVAWNETVVGPNFNLYALNGSLELQL